jgi:hypothetical protein
MLEGTAHQLDNAKPRLIATERFTHRSGGDHFNVAVSTVGVSMIVTGEKVSDSIIVEAREISIADFPRDVEVLIRFIRALKEIGNVLKNEDVRNVIAAGAF